MTSSLIRGASSVPSTAAHVFQAAVKIPVSSVISAEVAFALLRISNEIGATFSCGPWATNDANAGLRPGWPLRPSALTPDKLAHPEPLTPDAGPGPQTMHILRSYPKPCSRNVLRILGRVKLTMTPGCTSGLGSFRHPGCPHQKGPLCCRGDVVRPTKPNRPRRSAQDGLRVSPRGGETSPRSKSEKQTLAARLNVAFSAVCG